MDKPKHSTETVSDVLGSLMNDDSTNALFDQLQNCQTAEVKRRLDQGPGLARVVCKRTGGTILSYAAVIGEIALIDACIRAGSNIHHRDAMLSTPLMAAVERGQHRAIECLLEHGANPNELDGHAWSPLGIAIDQGDIASVRVLYRHRARRIGMDSLQQQLRDGYVASNITVARIKRWIKVPEQKEPVKPACDWVSEIESDNSIRKVIEVNYPDLEVAARYAGVLPKNFLVHYMPKRADVRFKVVNAPKGWSKWTRREFMEESTADRVCSTSRTQRSKRRWRRK